MFSIDPEGMENTCTTNALSRIVRTSAARTITVRSRQKGRFRLVACWPLSLSSPVASASLVPSVAGFASSSDSALVVR